MNVSKLVSLNIVTNEGVLTDFPELNKKQVIEVIKSLLEKLNKTDNLQESIKMYLDQSVTGNNIWKTFPEVFVSQIIRSHQGKMIDNELLSNDKINKGTDKGI